MRNRNKEWRSVAGCTLPLVLWMTDRKFLQVQWKRLSISRSKVGEIRTLRSAERQHIYTHMLGFQQVYVDGEDRWARLTRDGVEIALAEGEFAGGEPGDEDAIATLQVGDLKAEADRLREAGVNVGVVLEIPGTIRLLDVFDPDGNRIQLSQDV